MKDKQLFIDGLNTSLWGPPEVFKGLSLGGLSAINATIAIWDDFNSTMDKISMWYELFDTQSDLIRQVKGTADIQEAFDSDRCGIIFGWQNATPIGNDLRRLRLFHDLGVKIIQITYNERNLLGNGCYELHDDGLSKFGQTAIREMNDIGILIDLSHVGDRTTLETIEISEAPVAITHSNARSMDNHPRNKTDETIKLLAEKGGIIGSNGFPMFFPNGFKSTLNDYLDRIEYLLQLVGPDHVAIGSDLCEQQPRSWFRWLFSSQGTIPPLHVEKTPEPYTHLHGFSSALEFGNLSSGLLDRGYSEEDIRKIMGENWMNLFRRVWEGNLLE